MIIYEYDGHLHFTKELNFSKPYNSLYSVNLNNPVIIYFNNETYIHWKKNFFWDSILIEKILLPALVKVFPF